MASLEELIINYKEDLVNITNCSVMIIAALEKYIEPDERDKLKIALRYDTQRNRAQQLWDIVLLHLDVIDIELLLSKFRKGKQGPVVEILERIKTEMKPFYRIIEPLEVVLTKQKPGEIITRNPDMYPMDRLKPGVALFFNITTFNDPAVTRPGAQKDTEYLEKLFRLMNFNVLGFPGSGGCLTEGNLKDILENDVPQILANSNPYCLVVFIGSHMSEGEVLMSDGANIHLHDKFVSPIHDACSGSYPKIFIVQGCRKPERPERLPYYQDTIICYSTLPGEISMRHPEMGSLYIRVLTEVFMREAYRTELKDMLAQVRRNVIKVLEEKDDLQVTCYDTDPSSFKLAFYFHIP